MPAYKTPFDKHKSLSPAYECSSVFTIVLSLISIQFSPPSSLLNILAAKVPAYNIEGAGEKNRAHEDDKPPHHFARQHRLRKHGCFEVDKL